FVAAHYDRITRRVTVHLLGPTLDHESWFVYPDLHCVAVGGLSSQSEKLVYALAVDLMTHDRFPNSVAAEGGGRVPAAWDRAIANDGTSPYTLSVKARWSKGDSLLDPHLFLNGNTLKVKNADPPWVSFEPTRDGRPMFGGAAIYQAQLAGTTLAV